MVYKNCESHKMGATQKNPVNACGMRGGLSRDMLSRGNLVLLFGVYYTAVLLKKITGRNNMISWKQMVRQQ